MIKLTTLALTILLCACTNSDDANRALTAQGFTNIRMTGYDWFACAKDDFYHTGFEAKNSNGLAVSGVVCSGIIFKSATIRF